MNIKTTSRALALIAAMAGMSSVALAQTSEASKAAPASSGVTNVSVPKAAAPAGAANAQAAQAAVTQTQAPTQATLTPPATNRVGDASTYLLALQASGQYASRNSYPVTSDVAQRTYQRYLESFTHKIPESSETQVGNKTGGSR